MKKIDEPDWDNELILTVKCEEWFAENIKGNYIVKPDELSVVYGNERQFDLLKDPRPDAIEGCTHKAVIILDSIEPIEKDSKDKLLRDLIEVEQDFVYSDKYLKMQPIIERAKKLLADKDLRCEECANIISEGPLCVGCMP